MWTLQSFSEPMYGIRVVTVYSCDAHLEERSDIFTRSFFKAYPRPADGSVNAVPSPEEMAAGAADSRPELTADQQMAVESKTLSIIRYAHRFHNLDLEGLVLEFIFDRRGQLMLHGCSSASACSAVDKRRFRGPDWSRQSGSTVRSEAPRAFQVPVMGTYSSAYGETPSQWQSTDQASTSRGLGGITVSWLEEGNESFRETKPDYSLLLEFWQGEAFLGETLVPCPSSSSTLAWSPDELRMLKLKPGGLQPPVRPDGRKLLADPSASHGTAVISTSWSPAPASGSGPPIFRFRLGRAESLPQGFPLPNSEAMGVRALLWLQRPHKEFQAVWSSTEAENVEEMVDGQWSAVQVWNGETVELSFPEISPQTEEKPPPVMSPPPPPASSEGSGLRSVHDHVCGAELATHWGMCELDGTMRGHVLASQVLQRLGLGRSNRSGLMKRLAHQVGSFHAMQQSWEAMLEGAKNKTAELDEQLKHQEEELAKRTREIDLLVEQHQQKLASTCRRMTGQADEHRARISIDSASLAQSRLRVAHQQQRSDKLEERRMQLDGSLERSRRKLEQLLNTHAKMQEDLNFTRARHFQANDAEIATVRAQAHGLQNEVQQNNETLAALTARLAQVKQASSDERRHILKLEDCIRRVAEQPGGARRTGGGFMLDNLAKQEAQEFVQDTIIGYR